MKKIIKNKLNIIGFIDIIASILLIVLTLKLDILPIKYIIIFLIAIIIINILGIVLINVSKKILKTIGCIICIISILVSTVASYYLYYGLDFLNNSFENSSSIKVDTFYILTYKDNKITNKKDISGNILYYKDTTNIKKALKNLKKTNKINPIISTDLSPMFKKVASKEEQFLLINKTTYEIIYNLDSSLNKNDYKVIGKVNVYTKNKKQKQDIKDTFNLYIGGNDFTGSLMDFNMIITVNRKTGKVLLTSIPRDYYIEEAYTNGKKDTLSYMGANGIEVNKKSLENFLNIKIDYYMKINTKSLVKIVDSVDGITFCSDLSFTTTHAQILDSYDDTKGKKLYIKKGCQHLNGIQTLTVARERKQIPGSDVARQKNCQKILLAIIDKLKSTNTITNYNNILNSFSDFYETDMKKDVITSIIKDIINGKSYQTETQILEGTDTHDYVHLTTLIDWVMYPDENSVNNAKEKINEVLNEK